MSYDQAAWHRYAWAKTVSERRWYVSEDSTYCDNVEIHKSFKIDGKNLGQLRQNDVIRVAVDQRGVMWMAFSETGDRVEVRVLCVLLRLLLLVVVVVVALLLLHFEVEVLVVVFLYGDEREEA